MTVTCYSHFISFYVDLISCTHKQYLSLLLRVRSCAIWSYLGVHISKNKTNLTQQGRTRLPPPSFYVIVPNRGAGKQGDESEGGSVLHRGSDPSGVMLRKLWWLDLVLDFMKSMAVLIFFWWPASVMPILWRSSSSIRTTLSIVSHPGVFPGENEINIWNLMLVIFSLNNLHTHTTENQNLYSQQLPNSNTSAKHTVNYVKEENTCVHKVGLILSQPHPM